VTLSAVAHLANKPGGIVLFLLVVAALCFFAGAVIAALARAWWAVAVSVGLAVLTLAFLVT
jgi:hypothetical protein